MYFIPTTFCRYALRMWCELCWAREKWPSRSWKPALRWPSEDQRINMCHNTVAIFDTHRVMIASQLGIIQWATELYSEIVWRDLPRNYKDISHLHRITLRWWITQVILTASHEGIALASYPGPHVKFVIPMQPYIATVCFWAAVL